MTKDEIPVFTIKPPKNHYIHLATLFTIALLWGGLLLILFHATFKGVIITKNPSDLPFYLLGIFLIAPIIIFMIYTNLGRWVVVSKEGISYPFIIKWRKNPKIIPFKEIKGYTIQYDIYDKEEITMVSILLDNGKKVKFPAHKSVNVCEILIKVLKKKGVTQIQQ
ncbi:hypothetical protein DRO38_02355 [Candidatus Bathyarchaeota archaeon]|nr:MAG: hypothetical protein DRO38_02355 [Candidatus Bathyarchaeota archaeon]